MICLNMIVRNESRVIRRCLKSVKPLIGCWVIVDTGSEDGTQALIEECLGDIPGELLQRPWVDFSHNRNEALEAAKGEYVLFMDADDRLVWTAPWPKRPLDQEIYVVRYCKGGCFTKRILLVDARLDWKWQGAVHECLVSGEAKTSAFISEVYIEAGDGGFRARNPETLKNDLRLLRQQLGDKNQERTLFHLGVFSEEAGEDREALQYYSQRAALDGWDEEIFYALFRIAALQQKLRFAPDVIRESYRRAYAHRPSRLEPLVGLALYEIEQQNLSSAYELLKKAKEIPFSSDTIYVTSSLYEYGALMLFAETANRVGKEKEAWRAYTELLQRREVPEELRKQAEAKRRILAAKMYLSY